MTLPIDIFGSGFKAARLAARGLRDSEAPTGNTDRVIAAAVFVGLAIIVAWPKGQAVPEIIQKATEFGRSIWGRRDWFIN